MLLSALFYFLLGILDEALVVAYYIAIDTRNIASASCLTVVIGLLGYSVFKKIVLDKNNATLLSFILGNGVGTMMTMMFLK